MNGVIRFCCIVLCICGRWIIVIFMFVFSNVCLVILLSWCGLGCFGLNMFLVVGLFGLVCFMLVFEVIISGWGEFFSIVLIVLMMW